MPEDESKFNRPFIHPSVVLTLVFLTAYPDKVCVQYLLCYLFRKIDHGTIAPPSFFHSSVAAQTKLDGSTSNEVYLSSYPGSITLELIMTCFLLRRASIRNFTDQFGKAIYM